MNNETNTTTMSSTISSTTTPEKKAKLLPFDHPLNVLHSRANPFALWTQQLWMATNFVLDLYDEFEMNIVPENAKDGVTENKVREHLKAAAQRLAEMSLGLANPVTGATKQRFMSIVADDARASLHAEALFKVIAVQEELEARCEQASEHSKNMRIVKEDAA